LVGIHPGCAEFLLPTALFAYRIIPISPYLAAAKHFGASSTKFACEMNA